MLHTAYALNHVCYKSAKFLNLIDRRQLCRVCNIGPPGEHEIVNIDIV